MPCLPAISSHSLGRAWVHDLEPKLNQARRYGLDIEMFFEDLEYLAHTMPASSSTERLRQAARKVRSMCDDRSITIVCLQPFMHYEGLRDRQLHRARVEEFKVWVQLAKILRTDIIAIPSTCLPKSEVSGDKQLIADDLREVADIAGPEGIRVAYESLAWGTYADTWDDAWAIVKAVDRPNFGICLDTFNMAARVYADPSSPSRKNADAEKAMKASLDRMIRTIEVEKIFFVQVVDAEFLAEPLIEGHPFYNADQRTRMSWSRNCRLFYGEEGSYLPVAAILKAIIVDLGFNGWVSAELFNRSLASADQSVPEQHAGRAAASWRKIVGEFHLDDHHPRFPKAEENVAARAQL